MIKIEERLPKKIPGLTTLFISFKYDQQVVDAIKKNSEVYNYNKKTNEWEVPISSLSALLDSLSGLDDIDISVIEDKEDHYRDTIISNDYKTKPFNHQIDAIKYGVSHDKFLLLDDPGLGKTLSISYIGQEIKKLGARHILIICGINTLKTNWKKEIEKHTDLSCRILGSKINRKGKLVFGGLKDRIEDLKKPIDEYVCITNIESLRDDTFVDLLISGVNKFDLVALDECHVCKDQGSKQGSNLLKLNNITRTIGASGTLFINDPVDLFVPLTWIGAYNTTLTNFKSYFYKYGGLDGHTVVGFKNLDILNRDLSKVSLRRTLDDDIVNVYIPPKTVIEEYVDMSDAQTKFYNDIRKGIVDEVDKVKISKKSILGIISRLRQATVLPKILTSSNVESAKINRAEELCRSLIEKGEKVVVFSVFKSPVYELADKLKEYKPLINTGDISDETISRNIDKFQDDKDCKLFLATTDKCGTGITLNSARYLIFLDTPWTSAKTEQCEERIHRIGSKEHAFIYRLITTGTIDEKVEELVLSKKALADYIVDGEVSEELYDVLVKYVEELKNNED